MALVNFVTFVVLKILDNIFSMQNSLNANNCRRKQTFENCPTYLAFISNVLSESSFQQFLLKRMLIVSHKVVSIENEAVLLCVTMRERAKAFVATIQCITFAVSLGFCRYKVQILWWTFQTQFGMSHLGISHLQKVVRRMKLFLSL